MDLNASSSDSFNQFTNVTKTIVKKYKKKSKLMGENLCLEVTSEIYTETNFRSSKSKNGMTISHFTFFYPSNHSDDIEIINQPKKSVIDKDGDLILERRRRGVIKIEHQQSTNLSLVGLQVWRGALILADFLFHNRYEFEDKRILELGSGVGLTSIAAAIHSKTSVVSTDVDMGGILDVIKSNVNLNKSLINTSAKFKIFELDFKQTVWPDELKNAVSESNIIIAADVIYDNSITDHFIKTLERLLDTKNFNKTKEKEIYIALEKRYVFTLAELDTVAPCYEYFLQRIEEKNWQFESVDLNFPQYFDYERKGDLIIMKLYV